MLVMAGPLRLGPVGQKAEQSLGWLATAQRAATVAVSVAVARVAARGEAVAAAMAENAEKTAAVGMLLRIASPSSKRE